MKARAFIILAALFTAFPTNAKTLAVYYKFEHLLTNNVRAIVCGLRTQIDCCLKSP